MKKITPFIFILITLFILFFIIQIFTNPPAPNFSHGSGFYQKPFTLSLTSTTINSTIHYTLDGSTPTLDSPIYTEPLLINDRTSQPNDISMIPTISYRFAEPRKTYLKSQQLELEVLITLLKYQAQ